MTETTTAPTSWWSWGTTDEEGNFVTLREQAQQRREDAVTRIADVLGETGSQPREQIKKIVHRLGVNVALEVLAEVLVIEENGGMMLPDGSRRRTPGGTFFRYMRDTYKAETRGVWGTTTPKQKKLKGPTTTPKKPKPEKQAQSSSDKTQQKRGNTVKLTLIGRPSSRVVDKDTYMLMVFQVNKVPSLPKGLPTVESQKTNYVVAVSSKQWKQVVSAMSDEEDVFIIEGYPALNKSGGIAVFTQSITTKKMQVAKRAKQETQV